MNRTVYQSGDEQGPQIIAGLTPEQSKAIFDNPDLSGLSHEEIKALVEKRIVAETEQRKVGGFTLSNPINAAHKHQTISGITASALMKKDFPDPRWAIPGILPEGLNLLAGKPKKGKSIFALNIGLSVASGGLALGKIQVQQGAVMYLALEDTERRLQGRIKQMLPYSEAPGDLHLFTKWPRMDQGGLELLEARMLEIANLRLVIIDTLQKFRNPIKASVNLYAEDYEVISKIKEVADRLGVCLLLIHHLRKAESDDIFDTMSGSLGLTGGADGSLIMENLRGQTTLHITGRDVEGVELAIELDPRILSWQLLGERGEVQATKDRQLLYDAIKNADCGVSPRILSEITGLKYKYIAKTLPAFLQDGSIRKLDRGNYIINR